MSIKALIPSVMVISFLEVFPESDECKSTDTFSDGYKFLESECKSLQWWL